MAGAGACTPNHLARSALFAPTRHGRRLLLQDVELASRADAVIRFSGEQLDMADCDVFLQALQLAREIPLGERVYFSKNSFLKALGKSNAGAWYVWLQGSLERLQLASISVATKRYRVGGETSPDRLQLIRGFEKDPSRNISWITFDPRVATLFGNREYALVDGPSRSRLDRRASRRTRKRCPRYDQPQRQPGLRYSRRKDPGWQVWSGASVSRD